MKVRRTGFFLVPDFASTAHMIQGQSLEAAFVDLVTRGEAEQPTDDIQVSGYVMLSRAKKTQISCGLCDASHGSSSVADRPRAPTFL